MPHLWTRKCRHFLKLHENYQQGALEKFLFVMDKRSPDLHLAITFFAKENFHRLLQRFFYRRYIFSFCNVTYFVLFFEWHATSFLGKTFSTWCFDAAFSSFENEIDPLQDLLFLDTFFSFVLALQSLLFNAHYRQCLNSHNHYISDRF